MKSYILAIAGVILLTAVITVILPGGKTGKFLKGAMKLVILAVMISPVIGWVKSGKPDFAAPSSLSLDGGYLEACSARLERADEAEIASYILEEFSLDSEVEVVRSDRAPFSREKITVMVETGGIIDSDGHIDIVTCIKEAVEKRFGAQTEVSRDVLAR